MAKYLAGVDVGTTGTRCMIFDMEGRPAASHYCDYGADYAKPGWVEQDAAVLIAKTMETCRAAIDESGIDAREIASIGFSAQRSVTCPLARDGTFVRPIFSWQDARSGAEVEDLRQLVDADEYYAQSGVPLGTTWVIPKILWMRKNEPDLYAKTWKFVQNQDFILRAFGADDFYTDLCCMVFYGVWDVRKSTWNDDLLRRLDLGPEMFGKPIRPGTQVGTIGKRIAETTGFAVGTPICVGAGDQNCGVAGMGAVRPGMATVTLGTSGVAILATAEPVAGFGGMMITNHADGQMWEVEGLCNASGASLRWFRDAIATREKELAAGDGRNAYQLLGELAAQAEPGSKGLLYLPYLASAATPRWNPNARSAFIGLSLAHGRAELTRAVMEGVVLEIRDILQQWLDAGMEVSTLRIGGGATRSALWNQIQADVYGRPVETLEVGESTALGAALLGGLGAGVFRSLDEGVATMVKVSGQVEPDPGRHRRYEEMYRAYVKAYEGLSGGGAFDLLAGIQASAGSWGQAVKSE